MKAATHIALGIALTLEYMTGCEKAPELPPEVAASRTLDTAYVEVAPSFGGFTNPQDVMVGRDQLLYVADTHAPINGQDHGRVVMMNLAGFQLSERSILHPVSLGQDSRLDLLVGGEIVASNGDTVGALFRIHLVSNSPDSAHRLDLSRMDTVWTENAHPQRRFPGITVLPDNTWLAARAGTDNSSPIDPDARVVEFGPGDAFINFLPAFITGGQSPVSINIPTGIASIPPTNDFVLTQSAQGVSYAALWMQYRQDPEFEGWVTKYDPTNPIDFFRVGRYVQPEAVTIDKGRRDIFIADAALDSVFKYNSRGVLKAESFGLAGSGGVMKRPTGLAFFNRMLYVLDAQEGQVIRFILTTDIVQQ